MIYFPDIEIQDSRHGQTYGKKDWINHSEENDELVTLPFPSVTKTQGRRTGLHNT
jgi:hypothetical protein